MTFWPLLLSLVLGDVSNWQMTAPPSDPVVHAFEAESLEAIGEIENIEDSQATGAAAAILNEVGKGFKLAFGRLPAGIYAVWVCARPTDPAVIGASDQLKPLYLQLTVNSGAGGAAQSHRLRAPVSAAGLYEYITKIYFHAPEERDYEGELILAERSLFTQIAVDRIELRSPIGDLRFEPIKTQRTGWNDAAIDRARNLAAQTGALPRPLRPRPLTESQREARDDLIWNQSVPPLNACRAGSTTSPTAELAKAHEQAGLRLGQPLGRWTSPGEPFDQPWSITHAGLNLSYTMADLRAGSALPKPWPFDEDTGGVYHPDAALNDATIPRAVGERFAALTAALDDLSHRYLLLGDLEAAGDAAMLLAAIAYHHPGYDRRAHDFEQVIDANRAFGIAPPQDGADVEPLILAYDKLFPYIEQNDALAGRVGRFVSWVLSWQDVVRLIDTFLVQRAAALGKQAPRPFKPEAISSSASDVPAVLTTNAKLTRDERGIVTLDIVGLGQLDQANIKVTLDRPWHQAKILTVDHDHGTMTLDAAWPMALLTGAVCEIVSPRSRWTSTIEPGGGPTTVRLVRPTLQDSLTLADFAPSRRTAVLGSDAAIGRGVNVVATGRAIGYGSVQRGDHFFYTGYPEARRHLATVNDDDLTDDNDDGRIAVTANDTPLTVTGVRDDRMMLFTELPTTALPACPLTLRNESGSRQWTVTVHGERRHLVLDGARFGQDTPSTVELHVVAPGDTARTPGRLHMKRTAKTGRGIYDVIANTGATFKLRGRAARVSHDDGKTWRKLKGKEFWGTLTFTLGVEDLGDGTVKLKIE